MESGIGMVLKLLVELPEVYAEAQGRRPKPSKSPWPPRHPPRPRDIQRQLHRQRPPATVDFEQDQAEAGSRRSQQARPLADFTIAKTKIIRS